MEIDFSKREEITTAEDVKETPVKKRKWDRYLYLGIFFILLLSFLNWLVSPWIFNYADGLVVQDRYEAKFSDDIKVLQYNVKEGQYVRKGAPIFTYEYLQKSNEIIENSKEDSIKIVLDENKAKGDLINVDANIEKRRQFMVDLQKRLNFWKADRTKKEKLVYLNVINPNEISTVDRTIDDISYQLATIKAEYIVLQKERELMLRNINRNTNIASTKIEHFVQQKMATFYAPISGKIGRLRVYAGQIATKNEIVTAVLKPDFFVKAYIEVDDLEHFKLNDKVAIKLPYGRDNKISGRISKIYTESEAKEDNILKPDPNESRYGIVMEVVPIDKKAWSKIQVSNIPIKVRKIKF